MDHVALHPELFSHVRIIVATVMGLSVAIFGNVVATFAYWRDQL